MEDGPIETPQQPTNSLPNSQNTTDSNAAPIPEPAPNPTPQQPQSIRTENINPVILQRMGGTAMRDVREILFEALFIRISISYAARFPMSARRLFESLVLFLALSSLGLLMYVHTGLTYIQKDCLTEMKESWPRDGILRVEVVRNVDPSYDIKHSYAKEALRRKQEELDGLDLFFPYSEHGLLGEEQNEEIVSKDGVFLYTSEDGVDGSQDSNSGSSNETSEALPEKLLEEPLASTDTSEEGKKSQLNGGLLDLRNEPYIIEYASEYGILHLTQTSRRRLNVSMGLYVIDPEEGKCLKKSLDIFIFDNFLGYDDVIMEAIKQVADGEVNKGNLRNIITGESFRLITAEVGGANYVTVAFVMMIFTLSVSMLLRFSHNQIFFFIVELLNVIEANMQMRFPVGQMLTVILALVGMEAIMSEFFKDSTTSFYVIVLVWFCDQYDALCSHTAITKKYWPRFFFLYHFAFYAHHYRFHGQHSGLALLTSILFIVHIMIYFYHHHELPQMLGVGENTRQDRQQRTDVQPFGLIIQNYINRPAQAPRQNQNLEGLQGIPGVVIRNQREENRGGNILRQNIVLGMGGIHQHAHMRGAHLSVLLRNLRNAVRDNLNTAPAADTSRGTPPPQNPQENAPSVVPENTTEQQEIINRIDSDSDSAFAASITTTDNSTQSNSSTSESEVRHRHVNQDQ